MVGQGFSCPSKEMESMKSKIFTIPNILSFFRILLIPVIVLAYFNGNAIWAFVLIGISGLTDIVDGFIARKFNMTSKLGKILDPIADKLTQITVFVCLCFSKPIMWLLVGILVVKELAMGIQGYFVMRRIKEPYSAKWFGKVSTVLLYATMLLHVVWEQIPFVVSALTVSTCVSVCFLSWFLYTHMNLKILKDAKKEQNLD